MTSMKKRSTAVLTAAILATALTIPATATAAPTESIRMSRDANGVVDVRDGAGSVLE